jgi:hypothetical protein
MVQFLSCQVADDHRQTVLPNDVTAPSSPSLLLRANLLIFAARLDEAIKAGHRHFRRLRARAQGGAGRKNRLGDDGRWVMASRV